MPYAMEEAEPKEVLNTGNVLSEKSIENPEWI